MGAGRELALRLRRHPFVVQVLDFLELLPVRLGPALRGGYRRPVAVCASLLGWLLSAAAAPAARAWCAGT